MFVRPDRARQGVSLWPLRAAGNSVNHQLSNLVGASVRVLYHCQSMGYRLEATDDKAFVGSTRLMIL
jgi:hypothetical protein